MMQSKAGGFDLRGLTLVVVAVAWLVGIFLDSRLPLPSFALIAGACTALLLLIPLWRDVNGRLAMLIVLGLLLGAWRYTVAAGIEDIHLVSQFIGAGKIEIQGSVSDEPKLAGKSLIVPIAVSSISTDKGVTWQQADGQVEAQTLDAQSFLAYGPNYGDTVELQGNLQPPSQYSSPGTKATMAFPRLTIRNPSSDTLLVALFRLRLTLANVLAQSLPQPEAALLVAILLGLRTPVLKPIAPLFNETGTAHLIAPSGFKVTLLAGLINGGTRWLYEKPSLSSQRTLPAQKRGRRWIATALVIACIAIYTILNGAGPAALRAGIMGTIMVLAPRVGRVYNVYTSLAAAALLITLFDPFALWDVGFQLSFAGTLGIVLLTPLFHYFLRFFERLPLGHIVAEIVAVTLAAQVATVPLLAVYFQQVSLIAPVANILTVPLLGILIMLGLLICGTGWLFAPLGILCGWVAWPLLWYVGTVVERCSQISLAYLTVSHIGSEQAWCYYGLLTLLIGFLFYRWPHIFQRQYRAVLHVPLRLWRILQVSAALIIVLATGTSMLTARSNGRFMLTFLNVGPANQSSPGEIIPQGEAIFIQTPDGKSALIDGGSDATSLAQELDSRLPSWQRTLDVVILTSPRSDALTGLQDVVSRYSIGAVLDAGMLHPNASYGLWRKTIADRHLNYVQAHQGMTVPIGSTVMVQVLWPVIPLHKSSNEEIDNSLIVHIVAPGVSLLLLGVSILSNYALTGLLASVDASYLQANIVQVVDEAGKKIPAELSTLLQMAKPSLLVITPAALSAKQRKAGATSILEPVPPVLIGSGWQTVQTAQTGAIVISSNNLGWSCCV